MREIKFRAALKKEDDSFRVVDVCQINFDEGPSISFEESYHVTQSECEFILLQFTGLLDKNGKEIYEGDILKCGEYINQMDDINKMKYEWWEDIKDKEIIGNIYENPELLDFGDNAPRQEDFTGITGDG